MSRTKDGPIERQEKWHENFTQTGSSKIRPRPAVRGPRLWPSAHSFFDALSCVSWPCRPTLCYFVTLDNVQSMSLCFPTSNSRALPSHMARARLSHETPFSSLSYWKFRYHTQHKQETVPHDIIQPHIPSYQFNGNFSLWHCASTTHIFYLWRRPVQPGHGLRNACLLYLATASATWRRPAQRVSLIFGDGQRNLATARAIC